MGLKVKGKVLIPGGHLWELDEEGEIDEFASEYDVHAGPRCLLCYYSFCMSCKDMDTNLNSLCDKNKEAPLPGMEFE